MINEQHKALTIFMLSLQMIFEIIHLREYLSTETANPSTMFGPFLGLTFGTGPGERVDVLLINWQKLLFVFWGCCNLFLLGTPIEDVSIDGVGLLRHILSYCGERLLQAVEGLPVCHLIVDRHVHRYRYEPDFKLLDMQL